MKLICKADDIISTAYLLEKKLDHAEAATMFFELSKAVRAIDREMDKIFDILPMNLRALYEEAANNGKLAVFDVAMELAVLGAYAAGFDSATTDPGDTAACPYKPWSRTRCEAWARGRADALAPVIAQEATS